MGTWFIDIIRGLFAFLDKILVFLVESLYNLIFEIANVEIFKNQAFIEAFSHRITVILTIFMIFKLSFSFLTYIINPDQMNDKSKGIGKIIQNVAISLVLLTTYQFLFDKAMDLQHAIIDNDTIPKLIIGVDSDEGKNAKNPGTLSFALFSSFFIPNSELLNDNPECISYAFPNDNEPAVLCEGIVEYRTGLNTNSIYGDNVEPQLNGIVANKDTRALYDYLLPLKKDGVYAFDYWPVISTACGVFASLILLSFCFDIAIRSIKLSFLRLIAPVPIISYVDPNKGEGIFKKWLASVGKTYADLFIRLIAIFFAIYIIQMVISTPIIEKIDSVSDIFVIIFIILGALMFAKQLPKLIQDITGINLNAKLQLNPLKRIREEALGGKYISKGSKALSAGVVAGGVAAAGNAINKIKNFKSTVDANEAAGKKFAKLRALGGIGASTLGGALGGFSHSAKSAAKEDKFIKGMSEGITKANTNRTQREISRAEGATALGIMRAKIDDKLGLETKGQRMKREVEESKDIVKIVDEIRKEGLSEISKNKTYEFTDANGVTQKKTYAEFGVANAKKAIFESLKNADMNQMVTNAVQNYRNEKSMLETKISELQSRGVSLQAEMVDAKSYINSYGLNENDSFNENAFIKYLTGLGNTQEEAHKTADRIREAYSKFTAANKEYKNVSSEYSKADADLTANYSETEDDVKKKTINKYTTDLQNAQKELKDAEDEAVKVLYEAVLNGEIDDAEVKARAEALARKVKHAETYDSSTVEIFEGNDFDKIDKATKKIKSDAIMKENSEEYRKAQAEHVASGIGEGSYNNYKNPNATKR